MYIADKLTPFIYRYLPTSLKGLRFNQQEHNYHIIHLPVVANQREFAVILLPNNDDGGVNCVQSTTHIHNSIQQVDKDYYQSSCVYV